MPSDPLSPLEKCFHSILWLLQLRTFKMVSNINGNANEGKLAAQPCGGMFPRYVLQLLFSGKSQN
jgi:hypothetical protein